MKFELLLLILAVLLPWQARAAAGFTYEGYLTDDHDEPVGQAAAVTLPMTFEILGDNGGTLCVLYTEARNVPVSQGHFAVRVGGPSAQTSNLYGNANFGAIFSPKILTGASSCSFDPNAAGAVRKLRVTVDGTQMGAVVLSSAPTAMVAEQVGLHTPKSLLRVEDSEVPMPVSALSSAAFNRLLGFATDGKTYLTTDSSLDAAKITGTVANATNAVNATTAVSFSGSLGGDVIGNQSATTVTGIRGRAISNSPPANDQVLQWDAGANSWTPKTLPATGTGTVTSVSTGLGLTGGPINGSGTISVATGGIGTIHLADSSVTSAKIADGTITTVDLGDAQVTDAKIAGVGVDKIISGSNSYFTYKPAGTACANGEVLKWSGSPNNRWECAAVMSSMAGVPLSLGKILIGDGAGKAQEQTVSGELQLALDGTGKVTKLLGVPLFMAWGGGPNQVLTTNAAGNQWNPTTIDGELTGSIGSMTIKDGKITTTKIQDGAVTGAKLETLGLTPGNYGSANAIPSITVDAKGRITAITTGPITGLPAASGTNGKYLKSDGTNWAGANITFADIKNSSGTSAFSLAGCLANQTVSWSSLTDMFTCQNIGSLDGGAITSGTIAAARLPAGASMWQDGGSGKIFYNGGYVGIGTNNPGSALDVAGTIRTSGLVGTGSGLIQGGVGSASVPSLSFANDANTGLYNPSPDSIGVSTGGLERMRIDASGNMGIGTTSPSERLDLGDGNIKMGYSRGSCGFTRAATGTQTYTCTCSNPSSFIVSGGCKTDNVSYLFDSYPVSNTSWACTYSFSSSGTTNISIWTVCANIR